MGNVSDKDKLKDLLDSMETEVQEQHKAETSSEEQGNAAAEPASQNTESSEQSTSETETQASELTALQEELSKAKQQTQTYWDRLVRKEAEMQNVQKIADKRIADAHKFALEKFIKDLLVIVDTLEHALAAHEGEVDEGLTLTHKLFLDTLENHGVTVVSPQGETFDPNFHEAISMQEDAEKDPNTILNVVQNGYCLNERLIRPARVVVSTAPKKVDEKA